MSVQKGEGSAVRPLSHEFLQDLGNRVTNAHDPRRINNASWKLYGGLYRLVHRFEAGEGPTSVGWSSTYTNNLLVQAESVAGIPRPLVSRKSRELDFVNRFKGLQFSLIRRLDNDEPPITTVKDFNHTLLDGYETMVDNVDAIRFVVDKGIVPEMNRALKEARVELNRQQTIRLNLTK